MSIFHERLKALKDRSGKTQVQIAEGVGLPPQNMSYYFNGREPSYDVLLKLADYFNVSTDYLLGRPNRPLRKVIALDFDGTLCENNYPNIGTVKSMHKVVHEYIRAEHKKGTVIILWTCRSGNELGDAVEFCMKNDIPIDYVNENDPERVKLYGSDSRKISADMYIDDKAVDLVKFNYLRETDRQGDDFNDEVSV